MKYLIEIEANLEKETVVDDPYYPYKTTKKKTLTQPDSNMVYEAVSKYLQVKGFITSCVKVTEYTEPTFPETDEVDDNVTDGE